MDAVLVDGKNWCYRHMYARRNLRTSKGAPTGLLHGSVSGILRLSRHFPEAAIVFCWDGGDKENSWRHKLDKLYKANRRAQGGKIPAPLRDMQRQMPELKKFLGRMGFAQFEVLSLEADDLIGVLAEELKSRVENVYIYSTDFDMTQLIGENVRVVRDSDKTARCRPITEIELMAQKGFSPSQFLSHRALVGDKGDGIPSAIPKVGPKTAAKLLAGGLDPSKDRCVWPGYEKYWKRIRLNYRLSRIIRSADSPELPKKTRDALSIVAKRARRPESLFRSGFKTKERYKEMVEFFKLYELEQAILARNDLWSVR